MLKTRPVVRFVLALVATAVTATSTAATAPVRVFAAASLTDAVGALIAESGVESVGIFASSGALARQIDQGAPADVFLSANPEWMAFLEGRGALATPPEDFASNRLVAVTRESRTPPFLAAMIGEGARLATADTEGAPAGVYARAALVHLGLWDRAGGRHVQSANVRDALGWALRGDADLAIVYRTDALPYPELSLEELPADAHPPIRYVAAAVSDDPRAAAFLRMLTGAKGRAALASFGFDPPVE